MKLQNVYHVKKLRQYLMVFMPEFMEVTRSEWHAFILRLALKHGCGLNLQVYRDFLIRLPSILLFLTMLEDDFYLRGLNVCVLETDILNE